jgi:hypothetical protein
MKNRIVSLSLGLVKYEYLLQKQFYILTTNQTGTAEKSVEKRFSQFKQFHEQLTLLCPGLIIPPLPCEQPISQLDYHIQQKEEFVEERLYRLQAFMHKVLAHSELKYMKITRAFIDPTFEQQDPAYVF